MVAATPTAGTDIHEVDNRTAPLATRGNTRTSLTVLSAALIPLVIYIVMSPERYGLTPNPLDPVFYTGYTNNFNDIMSAVGDRWYFVSRWSTYLPARAFVAIAGAADGRLLWRWVLATGIVLSLWRMGRRWNWTTPQRLLIASIALTMPMFVRAFMTDYVEYIVVALGICIICLALGEHCNSATQILIGGLSALMVIANPVAITAVILPCIACVLLTARSKRGALMVVTTIAVGGAIPIVAGYCWFRWRYGMDNVYRPTFDYIRLNTVVAHGVQSPNRDWLGKFTWIFAPPVLLASAALLARRTAHRFDRAERVALWLCGLQYSYQWFDEFARNGGGLELPYYWSYSVPSFVVALVVIVGHFFKTERRILTVSAIVAPVALLLVGVPSFARLPPGFWYAGCCLVAIVMVVWTARHSTSFAVVLLVVWITWTQIGAPTYVPPALQVFPSDPHYDKLYGRSETTSERTFDQILWFEKQMDRVPDDWTANFIAIDETAGDVEAVYGPHVTNKLVRLAVDFGLRERWPVEIGAGFHGLSAVYGPPEAVGEFLSKVARQGSGATVELDVTQPGRPGYRLAVLRATGLSLPITWPADWLPRLTGAPGLENSVEVNLHSTPGIVTDGPNLELPPGRYKATLTYSSDSPTTEVVGVFDVLNASIPFEVSIASIPGTGGLQSTITLPFAVTAAGSTWAFRTTWTGATTTQLTVRSVSLASG
jgi:hypothetical protein